MWGNRDPCNILLESDCSFHDPCDNINGYGNEHLYTPPPNSGYSAEGYVSPNATSSSEFRTKKLAYAAPNGFPARKTMNDAQYRSARPTEYAEQFSLPSFLMENHNTTTWPTKNGQNFARGSESNFHKKLFQPTDGHEHVSHGNVDNGVGNVGRTTNLDGYARQEIEEVRPKSNPLKCSREKPKGTPFSCNDCREPQCLYCWRKWRDPSMKYSFSNEFESHVIEPLWRPRKTIVGQYNDNYNEFSQNASRRSPQLEDPLHSQDSKLKSSACQPSHFEEPKWKSCKNLQESFEGPQNDEVQLSLEQHSKNQVSSIRENEWQWPLRKGRGMGPIQGEWVPPFRIARHSKLVDHSPQFQRSKGVGLVPNSDDWIPPFRGDEQPYNWHRCKGSGDCPPRDQWLAPWCDSNEQERVDQVYGGRRDGSYSEYPENFWRGEQGEVF